MDIASAFTEEAIRVAGGNVGGDEEDELREVFREIYEANEMDVPSRDAANVAVLFFVAGRTHMAGNEDKLMVPMSRLLATEFMEYLAQKGST